MKASLGQAAVNDPVLNPQKRVIMWSGLSGGVSVVMTPYAALVFLLLRWLERVIIGSSQTPHPSWKRHRLVQHVNTCISPRPASRWTRAQLAWLITVPLTRTRSPRSISLIKHGELDRLSLFVFTSHNAFLHGGWQQAEIWAENGRSALLTPRCGRFIDSHLQEKIGC